jgi:AcrR family transcriptional regulator
VAERGAAGVSLRETARRAGVSQAAPYHYFRSKTALLAAVGEAGFAALDQWHIAALARAPSDPITRLSVLVSAYLRFAIERPHYFSAMFRSPAGRYLLAGDAATRVAERFTEAVRAARISAGHDDLDPAALAILIWAIPHGLAGLFLDGSVSRHGATPVVLEHLARAAIEPILSLAPHEVGTEWAV